MAASLLARIDEQRDLIQALHDECQSITVRATNRDRSVSVEVDGMAAMTGLWLGETAYRNGADDLARQIVDTAQAAAKIAADRQRYLLERFAERLSVLERAPLKRSDGSTHQPSE
ncbi:YbaB/EbfC family nucleoid-associated protein [Mycolicibacterium arabiense]|uniref:YbaB/EbfC family nucleoid-associated protein n=1 Tax=Mycolicibacterium arabiense TaxID=1286181 RepID=UPI001F1BB722|nr:hypothetical protein [Mycolicibacterium arabiense]